MITNAELISEWITEQINLGKSDDDLHNKVFYEGSDIYIINKTNKKGIFDLKCTFGGAVSLKELREQQVLVS
ncbi:hypothetical protein M3664_04780 [Paenibacillus lautus]|uniref:hypothetical protein n=1 Tax=Paenibacillus lautus TaxID=1401 RepID=UPI00203FF6CF|nr:hypothetical protein [Paenibacillus lautus]MCM3257097.1 hypothetical protein [Paenibacillus lautus]